MPDFMLVAGLVVFGLVVLVILGRVLMYCIDRAFDEPWRGMPPDPLRNGEVERDE